MVEKATVLKLLDAIERRLERLQVQSGTSLREYLADPDLQAVVERNFEIAIQAAVDLGAHTLAALPDPMPETSREVFAALARRDWIESEVASRLMPMAGFRNVLAHGYADLDHEQVLAHLTGLEDLRTYVAQMTARFVEEGVLP